MKIYYVPYFAHRLPKEERETSEIETLGDLLKIPHIQDCLNHPQFKKLSIKTHNEQNRTLMVEGITPALTEALIKSGDIDASDPKKYNFTVLGFLSAHIPGVDEFVEASD